MSVNYEIPHPPAQIFENDPDILKKTPTLLEIDFVEFPKEGGILIHYKGHPFPKKGFPYPEAVESVCDVKRVIVAFMTFVSKARIFAPLFYIFQRPLIEAFVIYARRALERHYLKPQFLSKPVRHVYDIGMLYAEDDVERELVKIICHIIQYDSAYRIRMQTLAEDVSIANPPDIMPWLIRRGFQREKDSGQARKWLLLKVAYVFLPYKKFITRWVEHLDLEVLFLDEADNYYYPLDERYS